MAPDRNNDRNNDRDDDRRDDRSAQRQAVDSVRRAAQQNIQNRQGEVPYGWYAPTWGPACQPQRNPEGGVVNPTMPPWCPPQGGGAGFPSYPPICPPQTFDPNQCGGGGGPMTATPAATFPPFCPQPAPFPAPFPTMDCPQQFGAQGGGGFAQQQQQIYTVYPHYTCGFFCNTLDTCGRGQQQGQGQPQPMQAQQQVGAVPGRTVHLCTIIEPRCGPWRPTMQGETCPRAMCDAMNTFQRVNCWNEIRTLFGPHTCPKVVCDEQRQVGFAGQGQGQGQGAMTFPPFCPMPMPMPTMDCPQQQAPPMPTMWGCQPQQPMPTMWGCPPPQPMPTIWNCQQPTQWGCQQQPEQVGALAGRTANLCTMLGCGGRPTMQGDTCPRAMCDAFRTLDRINCVQPTFFMHSCLCDLRVRGGMPTMDCPQPQQQMPQQQQQMPTMFGCGQGGGQGFGAPATAFGQTCPACLMPTFRGASCPQFLCVPTFLGDTCPHFHCPPQPTLFGLTCPHGQCSPPPTLSGFTCPRPECPPPTLFGRSCAHFQCPQPTLSGRTCQLQACVQPTLFGNTCPVQLCDPLPVDPWTPFPQPQPGPFPGPRPGPFPGPQFGQGQQGGGWPTMSGFTCPPGFCPV